MRPYYLTIYLLLLQIFSGYSQASKNDPEEYGLQRFMTAKKEIQNGNYSKARDKYIESLPDLLKNRRFQEHADASIDLAVLYHWEKRFELAMYYITSAKNTLEEKVGVTSPLYGICLTNLSAFYYQKRQVAKSIEIEKHALNILENNNYDKNSIAKLLTNIALSQDVLGDYSAAIISLKRALSYGGLNDKNLATSQRHFYMGLMLLYQDNLDEALQWLNSSLNLVKSIPKSMQSKELETEIVQQICNSLERKGRTADAQVLISKLQTLQPEKDSYRKYFTLELMAKISNSLKDYKAAIRYSSAAIRMSKQSFNTVQKHPVIARQYTHLGEIYQADKQLDSATFYLHQGVIHLANGFEDQNIYSNPTVGQCFLEYEIIRSLRGKAKALYLRFQESKDLRDLKASLDTYQLTHDFIKKLKEDITTMGSKQRLAGDALEIYEEAIQAALALHEETRDEQYLEQALFFAESNKAILLLESMNERMAQSVSGIPDSLLEKEKQFRVDISYYEREINEENNKKNGEPDQEKIKQWDDKLYTLRREYQQLIDQFEEEFPKYYRLKYDTKLATVQDIRSGMIDRKTAFLEYFVGTEKIYLFEITKQDFKVHQLEKSEEFEENIREIQRMAKKPQLSTEEIPDFKKRIYSIYQEYVAMGVENLPSRIQRLLIVPDDLLNLIPFELLSRSEDGTDFMIKDYTIGYAYSASLFKASRKSGGIVADQLFLGYAPAFSAPMAENRSCAGDQLANLENSSREVVGIQALLGGNVMLGTDANRDSFLAQAGHYRIIHLATHACMDEENPMQSKVFFADEPIVNQDLFNLNLSADLAVLSACNTGSGQLVKGDGVLSLSKGFVHAGCPSAVMSLWSVDDFSTSEIMIDFYDYLKKGYKKDRALRQAKLDFIASADKVKKHPFFWAAFVQMGDPVALDLGQRRIPWKLIIVLAGLSLIGGYVLRRRNLAA